MRILLPATLAAALVATVCVAAETPAPKTEAPPAKTSTPPPPTGGAALTSGGPSNTGPQPENLTQALQKCAKLTGSASARRQEQALADHPGEW